MVAAGKSNNYGGRGRRGRTLKVVFYFTPRWGGRKALRCKGAHRAVRRRGQTPQRHILYLINSLKTDLQESLAKP